MDSALRNSIIKEKRKKTFTESLLGETVENKPDNFSFSLKPKTILCLSKDCGKIFKSRTDMMKHNIVHLLEKHEYIDELEHRKVNFNSQNKGETFNKSTLPVKKDQFHCSVPGCDAVCETFEGLKGHLTATHYELNDLIETSDCCSSDHTHDSIPSELNSPYSQNENKEKREVEVDRMLTLALMENQVLKQRLEKSQQAVLMYQYYLSKFQESGLDIQ